jgi:acetyltransferase-like isoleucine patch superfamily enzyme
MHGATIGRDCNVGGHAFVESGAVIGNNVTIKNHVCVWDGVTIEDEAFVGPHATFTNDLFPMSSLRRGDRAFTVSGTRLATIAPPKHVAGRMRNNFELRSLASRIVTFPRL